MIKKYLPIIALVIGFVSAFITAGVHSLFFILLPIMAFAFGYFSSWRRGLVSGFLLFLGYTIATALMWSPINILYPLQYFFAFMFGGFSLLLIGALASIVRRGIRKIRSVAVLVILSIVVFWCGYSTMPDYGYYYQVIIHSSEDLDNLELYLPIGAVSEDIYEELYDNPLGDHMASLTKEYTLELVDTEHGRMLKMTIPELMDEGPPGYLYTGNIIFWQRQSVPRELIHLVPRYDVVPVNTVSWGESVGPVKVKESRIIEEFKVPVKIISGTDADFELRLENRTNRGEVINFAYGKSNTYTELLKCEGSTGDGWVLVPVEVTERLSIRGVGD